MLAEAVYYFRQYIGLVLAFVAFALVAFAGTSERDYGIDHAHALYAAVAVAIAGVVFHEFRPHQRRARATFSAREYEHEWKTFKQSLANAKNEANDAKAKKVA